MTKFIYRKSYFPKKFGEIAMLNIVLNRKIVEYNILLNKNMKCFARF